MLTSIWFWIVSIQILVAIKEVLVGKLGNHIRQYIF